MKSRNKTYDILKYFLKQFKNQDIKLSVIWQDDSIREFDSEQMKKLQINHSIAWKLCISYSQNQNDIVKRSIEIILSRIQTLMIQISLLKKLWIKIFMIFIFLINISSISTFLYSELIENNDHKAVISYKAWTDISFNVQCSIYIIKSDIYIHKKESKLNFVSKLASHAKKMTLVKFKNSIIYQVYNWEKNKIHVSCSVEINEKSIKENESILTLNKRLDTQEFFNTEKSFIKCSTESSIIFSDRNENFNLLSDKLALKCESAS